VLTSATSGLSVSGGAASLKPRKLVTQSRLLAGGRRLRRLLLVLLSLFLLGALLFLCPVVAFARLFSPRLQHFPGGADDRACRRTSGSTGRCALGGSAKSPASAFPAGFLLLYSAGFLLLFSALLVLLILGFLAGHPLLLVV
jgi:hypothetical protein